ncbi:hypothetical protein ACJRO7_021579 [Eucalyptus globulus]|uniref:Uncharacterized protein n=1 Tax=Eucalyptus globulus TaxID=34317 RepID=A0ABD3KKD4_EUCGL
MTFCFKLRHSSDLRYSRLPFNLSCITLSVISEPHMDRDLRLIQVTLLLNGTLHSLKCRFTNGEHP